MVNNNVNQRNYGIILSYVEILCSTILNFFATGVFVRFLNQSEFGLYSGIVEMLGFFSVMDFGLTATLVRYYSKFKAKNDIEGMQEVSALCKRIYEFISLIIAVIGILIFFFLDKIYENSFTREEIFSAKKIYLMLLLAIVVNFFTQVYHSILSANERFIFLRGLNITVVILQSIVSSLVVIFYPKAIGLGLVQALFGISQCALKYFYYKKNFNSISKFGDFDKKLFKKVFNFSVFVFLTTIIDQFFWRSNIQIVGMTVNTQAVAIYGSALKIATKYMMLSTVVSGIFLPKVSGLVAQNVPKKQLSDLFIRVGRIQFLVLSFILSAFAVFGRQFVKIWLTDAYGEVYQLTLFFILPFTIELIQNMAIVIMQAQNRLKFRVILFAIISLLNVVITVPVVKNFGICVSSAVTGAIFGFGNLFVMNIYYSKKLHIDIKSFWLEILKIVVPMVASSAIGLAINFIPFFGAGFFNLALKLFLFSGVYFSIMWFFGMNFYEKKIVKSIFSKIFNFLKRS